MKTGKSGGYKKTHPKIVLVNWYNILICSSVRVVFPGVFYQDLLCCQSHSQQVIARKLLRLKGFIVLFLEEVGLFTLELSHDVFFLVSWWFQPISKVLVKLDHLPRYFGG